MKAPQPTNQIKVRRSNYQKREIEFWAPCSEVAEQVAGPYGYLFSGSQTDRDPCYTLWISAHFKHGHVLRYLRNPVDANRPRPVRCLNIRRSDCRLGRIDFYALSDEIAEEAAGAYGRLTKQGAMARGVSYMLIVYRDANYGDVWRRLKDWG